MNSCLLNIKIELETNKGMYACRIQHTLAFPGFCDYEAQSNVIPIVITICRTQIVVPKCYPLIMKLGPLAEMVVGLSQGKQKMIIMIKNIQCKKIRKISPLPVLPPHCWCMQQVILAELGHIPGGEVGLYSGLNSWPHAQLHCWQGKQYTESHLQPQETLHNFKKL